MEIKASQKRLGLLESPGVNNSSRAGEHRFATRQERREQFELQGDSYSTWIERETDSNHNPDRGLSVSFPKTLHFLRLDTPVVPSKKNAADADRVSVDDTLVDAEVPFVKAKNALIQGESPDGFLAPFITAPISQKLLAGRMNLERDQKSSLDTSNCNELNRIAAIRALELVEHQQELWLKQVKVCKEPKV